MAVATPTKPTTKDEITTNPLDYSKSNSFGERVRVGYRTYEIADQYDSAGEIHTVTIPKELGEIIEARRGNCESIIEEIGEENVIRVPGVRDEQTGVVTYSFESLGHKPSSRFAPNPDTTSRVVRAAMKIDSEAGTNLSNDTLLLGLFGESTEAISSGMLEVIYLDTVPEEG